MVKIECCPDTLKGTFDRLIEFIIKKKISNTHNIQINIILQGEKKGIEELRKLITAKVTVDNTKIYLFLKTEKKTDPVFDFWQKLLCNIGIGVLIDVEDSLKKSQDSGKENLAAFILEELKELLKKTDFEFANTVLVELKRLQEEYEKYGNKILKEKKSKKSKNVQNLFIDELPSLGDLQHGKEQIENKDANKWEKLTLSTWYKRDIFLRRWSELFSDKSDEKDGFNILIIDDLMWEKNWPNGIDGIDREKDLKKKLKEVINIAKVASGKEWNLYRFCQSSKSKSGFIESLTDNNNRLKIQNSNKSHFKKICSEDVAAPSLQQFTHILIDWRLHENKNYTGLNLIRNIKEWIDRDLKDEDLIPELIVLSRNPDPTTIQSALDAGASGYIVKDQIEALPLVIGRAGQPLKIADKKKIDRLVLNNFPCLRNFPAFVPKALYFEKWKKNKELEPKIDGDNDYENPLLISERKEWLNKIPKADLHVHFGAAIPLEICYDLAIISHYRWSIADQQQTENPNSDFKKAAKIIGEILKKAKNSFDNSLDEEFRRCYLTAFKNELKTFEISTVNDSVKLLSKKFKDLTEDQVACLLVAALSKLDKSFDMKTSIKKRFDEIKKISKQLVKTENESLLSFYLQDSTRIIKDVHTHYEEKTPDSIIEEIEKFCSSSTKPTEEYSKLEGINPLSSLLSVPPELQPKAEGLPKYLGALDLAGSGLLQFTETLILGSYHIVKWTSQQNVWHLELRASPTGFIKALNNPTLATKIMMLGLYAGINIKAKDEKEKEENNKHLTASVLISAKRNRDMEDIKKSVLVATEFIEKNDHVAGSGSNKKNIGVEYIPKVLGMDLAGIERGFLPEDLLAQFKESVRHCLLLSVHAGEDENVESVRQAIYDLHAARIGHGLRLDENQELKRFVRDRQICIELCPKSNQYTNGYMGSKESLTVKELIDLLDHNQKEFNNLKDKLKNDSTLYDKGYVFDSYRKDYIPVTINTDNPVVSHRSDKGKMDYPLAEEYLVMPHLVKDGTFNRLLALQIIYNGFKYSFLPPKEKEEQIQKADQKVFTILAEEFLNFQMSVEK